MDHGVRTRLVAAVILALVFGSGMLLGYAADGDFGAEPAEAVAEAEARGNRRGGDRRGGETRGEEPRRRTPLYEQVDPTEAQSSRIDSIMQAQGERMNQLTQDFREASGEYRSAYDALWRDTREAIVAVFTPEQGADYRRILADFDRRLEERSGRDRRNSSRGGRK